MDLPIACTLTEAELRERRRNMLEALRAEAVEVVSLPDGYSYTFAPSVEIVPRLAHLVTLERQCCPFLNLRILEEAGGGPVRFEVTGPPDASPVIEDFFGAKSTS